MKKINDIESESLESKNELLVLKQKVAQMNSLNVEFSGLKSQLDSLKSEVKADSDKLDLKNEIANLETKWKTLYETIEQRTNTPIVQKVEPIEVNENLVPRIQKIVTEMFSSFDFSGLTRSLLEQENKKFVEKSELMSTMDSQLKKLVSKEVELMSQKIGELKSEIEAVSKKSTDNDLLNQVKTSVVFFLKL